MNYVYFRCVITPMGIYTFENILFLNLLRYTALSELLLEILVIYDSVGFHKYLVVLYAWCKHHTREKANKQPLCFIVKPKSFNTVIAFSYYIFHSKQYISFLQLHSKTLLHSELLHIMNHYILKSVFFLTCLYELI